MAGSGGWGMRDRPGEGIKPSTWAKPDVGGLIQKLLLWYADKLTPVAEGIRGMLDSDKPRSIEEAVERYKDLPENKPEGRSVQPPPPKGGGLHKNDKYGIMN